MYKKMFVAQTPTFINILSKEKMFLYLQDNYRSVATKVAVIQKL